MKAVVAAFNQEKALVGAFSVITNLRMQLFGALMLTCEMQGDIVCLAMENRLDYCCYWLGLGMVGVTPALINNNLRAASLQHTITVVTSRAIIFSAETAPGGQGLSDYH